MQCDTGSKKVKSAQHNIPLNFLLQVVCVFAVSFAGMVYGQFRILKNHEPESYLYAYLLQMISDIIKVYFLLVLVDLDPNED